MFQMGKPEHPGKILKSRLPSNRRIADIAQELGVQRQTLSAILNGRAGVSPEMAARISMLLGDEPNYWVSLQGDYDLWLAQKKQKKRKRNSENQESEARMVNPESLERFSWTDLIKNSPESTCVAYAEPLRSMASNLKASGENEASQAFDLLADVSLMHFVPSERTEPYQPMVVYQGKRSMIPSDLTENQLEFLKNLLPWVEDPELRSRIGDILWLRSRDYESAQVAVDAFLKSAERLEKQGKGHYVLPRLERSFQLAKSLQNPSLMSKVKDRLDQMIKENITKGNFLYSASLLAILSESKLEHPLEYAKMANSIAEEAEKINDFDLSKRLWRISQDLWQRGSDRSNARVAMIRGAETNVKKADILEKGKQPNYLLISAFLEEAIQEFRQVGGEKERVDKLHERLLDAQRRSLKEMKTISAPIFPQEIIDRGVASVQGKSFEEALEFLAKMVTSPSKDILLKNVEDQIKVAPLHHLMPATIVDSSGRVVRRRPSVHSNDPDEVKESMKILQFSHAKPHRNMLSILIESVRQQIVLEHPVSENAWDFLVTNNPFVPFGREKVFSAGLHAGFKGNFLVSTHLLIPQLENSFREILSIEPLAKRLRCGVNDFY